MASRGRGRRAAAVPHAALPIAIPGRAPAPAVPQDYAALPTVDVHVLPTVEYWQFLDADQTLDGVDEDGRCSPSTSSCSSSSGSSGYGSCPSDSSVRPEAEDHWKERVVFASQRYPSAGINLVFNVWSPITDDEILLDDLAKLKSKRLSQSPNPFPVERLSMEKFELSLEEAEEPLKQHVADFSCSGPVLTDGDGQQQNAQYSLEDVRRATVVQRSNQLRWGLFSSWLPMPTDEEAAALAAILTAEEEELKRQAAVKKAAKLQKYRCGKFSKRHQSYKS